MILPLVSCVMPTANRRRFVPEAISLFLAQDYAHKELVILDDGAESAADLIPDDPQIRYIRLTGKRTLGKKRNECVEAARGDLIMHWDDDDWHAPHRIRMQIDALRAANAEICSVTSMLYYEIATGTPWLYQYRGRQPWVAGNAMIYTRDFWRRSPFPDMQVASDTRFIFNHSLARAVVLPDYTFYVAMIHPTNTSRKQTRGAYWSHWSGDLRAIMGGDLDHYVWTPPAPIETAPESLAIAAKPLPSISRSPVTRKVKVTPMRIGYVLWNFPPLTETFIRREILALCEAGHHVTVYAHHLQRTADASLVRHANLTVRQASFIARAKLAESIRDDGIEHLRSSLMAAAHRACYEEARLLQIPFSMTVYSGHDIFASVDQALYREASENEFCEALIVEDPFMRDWMMTRCGVREDKIALIANAFDLDLYRLQAPRQPHDRIVILAIARFIEKKGLIYLIRAFKQLCARGLPVELWLVGAGQEEAALRREANENVKFHGFVNEAQTRALYAQVDIFCLPCVQTARGDADGVATTILEAMAFELPIVTSDLLSAPYYVRHGQEGLLTLPHDINAITEALAELCAKPDLRHQMGQAGRARIEALCDIQQNAKALQTLMSAGRWRRWQEKLDDLQRYRGVMTPERHAYYTTVRQRSVAFFQPRGRLLDIGCGSGKIAAHMPEGVTYMGCDPMLTDPPQSGFPFVMTRAEALPFAAGAFDTVLIYAVLSNVYSVDAVLDEAARALVPGGILLLRECVNDPNPMHLNHLSEADLLRRVARYGRILATEREHGQLVVRAQIGIGAQPEAGEQAHKVSRIEIREQSAAQASHTISKPLVSIGITAYNRGRFLRQCIDSVLRQTYQPVEVVVVDDASTDDTRAILESYGGRIKALFNEQNRGIAYTKNRALLATSDEARYVGILDSDDFQHPRFVERCAAFLETHSQYGLVYTDDVLVDEQGREFRRQPAVHPWNVETWLNTCNLRGDTWLARRDLVMQTALHDETLSHDVDYDLFYQLLEITTFGHVAEFLVSIREHGGRTTRQQQTALAKCHAANLVKYGYSPKYAYNRARQHPEWLPAIEEGIALGEQLRAQRENRVGQTL